VGVVEPSHVGHAESNARLCCADFLSASRLIVDVENGMVALKSSNHK